MLPSLLFFVGSAVIGLTAASGHQDLHFSDNLMFGLTTAQRTWEQPNSNGLNQFPSRFCKQLSAPVPEISIPWLERGTHKKSRKLWCKKSSLWARWPKGQARVFLHACNMTEEPNAADAIIGQALRLTFEYFLGQPDWALRATCNPTTAENFEEADISAAALLVGGGGLFGSPKLSMDTASTSARSNWRWMLNETKLVAIEAAPVILLGVNCGTLCHELAASHYSHVSGNSSILTKLLEHPASVVGVRDADSVSKLPAPNSSSTEGPLVLYQPCPTTLLGLLNPQLASKILRGSRRRILSFDLSWHSRLTASLGGRIKVAHMMGQIVEWCARAYGDGWTIHLISMDLSPLQQLAAASPFLDYLTQLPHPPFRYRLLRFPFAASEGLDLLNYYRTSVTVAVSTQAHGIMIPFGLHVATIPLVVDDELSSFVGTDEVRMPWAVHLGRFALGAGGGQSPMLADKLWEKLCDIDTNRVHVLQQIQNMQGELMRSTVITMAIVRIRIGRKLANLRTRHRLTALRPSSTRLENFVNLHLGKTIYVVASGATAGYIAPDYFSGELAIGVNQAFTRFSNLTYVVRKESISKLFDQVLERSGSMTTHFAARGIKGDAMDSANGRVVLSKYCNATRVVVYEHSVHSQRIGNGFLQELPPVPDATHIPRLVSTASTITTAIHLAALMGAARIILVGHDLLSLDGQNNYAGYHDTKTLAISHKSTGLQAMQQKYRLWLGGGVVHHDTLQLRSLLKGRYPHLHINSLSPFIGLDLEGHHVGVAKPA